jgi:DNA polymerase III subunit alpha
MTSFIHLRVHTAYSLAEGAIKVKELIKLAVREGMPAVAVTDTTNLFGALEFAGAATDAGLQPIIGCQIGLMPHLEDPRLRPWAKGRPQSLLLLVQNQRGYENLMTLVSRAFLESETPGQAQLDWPQLEGFTDGLLCLTGGADGPVGQAIRAGKHEAAGDLLDKLTDLFPGRLYVELQRHGLETEAATERAFLDFAFARGLPLVATNDCYFADESLYRAHDVLLCIADGTYVDEEDRRRVTPHHYFKSAAQMQELFADLPEATANSVTIAKRCAYYPDKVKPILPPFAAEGRDEGEELLVQARAGLEERLRNQVFTEAMDDATRAEVGLQYRDRLEFEVSVIRQMGFPGYFLIVADFIKWSKRQGIPVGPGRGSGAGSVVAWALTITDLDPLRFGLLFERFLNPERVSMPDFDIDFCQDRREEVISYVQDRYGRDRVAQIITFGKLQARAVLRDVGRALQMPFGQVDRICKMVPNNPAAPVTLKEAVDGEPMLQAQVEGDETVKRLVNVALKLEGLYRHASTHAAGVVIADRPLQQLVPLYRDPRSDMPVTQFNMKYVELAGLVKFDFLGLKTLSVLTTAVRHIEEGGGKLDLERLPLDDRKTYEMLSRGESTGVFQLESSGMRDVLRKLKPNRFEDIIALVALYRPGPMDNIPRYIAVKNGTEPADYLHPKLEPILKETFGIMIYQEQVMQVAQVLSGYTLGGADLLRRAMGKKIKAEMDQQRAIFTDGAVNNGVNADQAGMIFDQVNKFAGYGFNKSHAAAYALVAYQTAYLKANYPVEFMAATMTYDINNTDKLNFFRQELDRIGVPLLPPDINASRAEFAVETRANGTKAVRYALAAIKGVGEAAMQMVVRERERSGPYRDIFDLVERAEPHNLNKRILERLVYAGGFDRLNANRAQLHGGLDVVLRHGQSAQAEKASDQVSLFGSVPEMALYRPELPKVTDWPALERLKVEFEAIGFYLSAHPLDGNAKALKRLGVVRFADLADDMRAGAQSTRRDLAGILVAKQERKSKTGNRFAFIAASDPSGVFEVMLFSEILQTARPLLEIGARLLFSVDVQLQGDDMRLTASRVTALDQALANAAGEVRVLLREPEPVAALKDILDRHGRGGRSKITVEVGLSEPMAARVSLPGNWSISPAMRQELRQVPGVLDVVDV